MLHIIYKHLPSGHIVLESWHRISTMSSKPASEAKRSSSAPEGATGLNLDGAGLCFDCGQHDALK